MVPVYPYMVPEQGLGNFDSFAIEHLELIKRLIKIFFCLQNLK